MTSSGAHEVTLGSITRKYYVSNETFPFEEGLTLEFKGHSNLCEEEVPCTYVDPGRTNRRSRQPISRVLNAFLNTGHGGTAYLGVLDTGVVKGMAMTRFKKDHLIINLDDLMSRYDPPVKSHRFKIDFVPVVPAGSSEEEILRTVNYKTNISAADRKKPHVLRAREYCWCDRETMAVCNTLGQIPIQYVVEITIHPWVPTDPTNANDKIGQMGLHPLHGDECGNVYVRKQASNIRCTPLEVLNLSKALVGEHYQPKIDRLKEEINQRL